MKFKIKRMSYFVCSILLMSFLFSCEREFINTEEASISSSAGYTVTIEDAEQMLISIMDKIDASGTKSSQGFKRTISNKYSLGLGSDTKSGDESLIHIFNFEDESGFAIMSGDKRADPLLAYALSGSLNEGDTIDNPGLAVFMSRLDGYFANLDTLLNDGAIDPGDIYINGYFTFSEMINGPCPVKWNQTYPYNYYCEEYSGGKTKTGCVVTAVAQLMACYRYPDSYDGYTFDWSAMIEKSNELNQLNDTSMVLDPSTGHNGNNGSSPGIIHPADLESYPSSEPDEAILQIAWLMYELGKADNIGNYFNYDSTATSASMGRIPETLEEFSFSSGGSEIYRSTSLENTMREDEAIAELEQGYYIIMAANELKIVDYEPVLFGSEIGTAHCWLVHGLMTLNMLHNDEVYYKRNYFQCNFGWGGAADGYYLCDVFDTARGPLYDDDYATKVHYDEGNFSDKPSMRYILGIRK